LTVAISDYLGDEIWRVEYEVEGTLPFPVDMLRYDGAFPEWETDSRKIESSIRMEEDGPVRVRLVAYADKDTAETHRAPNKRRWESFGWKVVAQIYEVPGGENL
jgi:hypothetical protein